MARGDVVAFIDDDAIPEPDWLTQLAAAYDSKEIGGAGGVVYDHTGYNYQYEYSTADRLGNANWRAGKRTEQLCFPGSFEFPYLQGTNASFRRSALLEVGGFDEEIEFYLDETELCCRLVDAGYVIRQLPNAFVHHKFAPSHVRDDQKITRYRYPVIKNKIYFALKHGRNYLGLSEILEDARNFVSAHAKDVEFHIEGGRLTDIERQRFREECDRAWERGLQRGLAVDRLMIDEDKCARYAGDFVQFNTNTVHVARTVVLVSRDFPPSHSGGIATFNKALGEALGEEGHQVHVITQSADINRVDLENGVWVHRVMTRETQRSPEAEELKIPQHIWNWSSTALAEVRRIAAHRRVDVVEAPIWDCEGIALLLARQWPLVTSLQTTLHFWLESHPEVRSDTPWMDAFGRPMLGLEKQLMLNSDSIRSISAAIKREIEIAYRFEFEEHKICIAPLGLSVNRARSNGSRIEKNIVVLYVGRLEHRKGIDVLLNVIPTILQNAPDVSFRIIGDDSLLGPSGKTYKQEFLDRHASQSLLSKVIFEGRVPEESMQEAYAGCDIFVAPSRFESFGLVFLEAMREGKPVIGCAAGGMPEIIAHGHNGLLVKPNDEESLKAAILRLIQSAPDRETMGQSGRTLFEKHFTAARMAEKSAHVYELAMENFRKLPL